MIIHRLTDILHSLVCDGDSGCNDDDRTEQYDDRDEIEAYGVRSRCFLGRSVSCLYGIILRFLHVGNDGFLFHGSME